MHRRSFITAMFGGIAVASLGGIALAEAAPALAPPAPAPETPVGAELPAETAQALDANPAEFSQYYYRRRPRVVYRRVYRRPVYRRPRYVYRRPVYVRPRRRVYYY